VARVRRIDHQRNNEEMAFADRLAASVDCGDYTEERPAASAGSREQNDD
jgi:hypothetical protein